MTGYSVGLRMRKMKDTTRVGGPMDGCMNSSSCWYFTIPPVLSSRQCSDDDRGRRKDTQVVWQPKKTNSVDCEIRFVSFRFVPIALYHRPSMRGSRRRP